MVHSSLPTCLLVAVCTAAALAAPATRPSTTPAAPGPSPAPAADADGPVVVASLFPTTGRVAFVIDASGTKSGVWENVVAGLTLSLDRLDGASQFYVVVVNEEAVAFRRGLVPADPRHVDAATAFVRGRKPAGSNVALPAAFAAALRLKPDVVVFLTDSNWAEGVSRRLADEAEKRKVPVTVLEVAERTPQDGRALSERTGGGYGVIVDGQVRVVSLPASRPAPD